MPATRTISACLLMALFVASCTQDSGDVGRGHQCAANLDAGYRDLNRAKANGLSGTVAWTKAASLLAAAKVQQQFEEYGNCVQKAQKARRYLSGELG